MTSNCLKSAASPSPSHRAWWPMTAAASCAASAASVAGFNLGASPAADQGRVDGVASLHCERRRADVKRSAGDPLNEAIKRRAVYSDAGHFKVHSPRGPLHLLGLPVQFSF